MKIAELFAGVGGIGRGFELAGYEVVYANDIEPKCKATYDLNFKAKMTVGDIREIDPFELPEYDILTGGFPCQPFSIAGKRQGFDDEKGRGNVFFSIINILAVNKPRAFMLENVKNLRAHDKGNTMKVILEMLAKVGYHVDWKVLNSKTHGGIPQHRERIFLVGFLDKAQADRFKFPNSIPCNAIAKWYLEHNVPAKYYYATKPLFPFLRADITDPNKIYQWRRNYVRVTPSGHCPTLMANMGTGGHNVPFVIDHIGIRKLTPRECFNLQGFDGGFVLPNLADSHLYKQAGNSVTVTVVERVAEAMRIAMEE